MKVLVINIKGALGSFQRPQSNNNPSTFYVMPKSALVGLICGNIGIDREIMKESNMYKMLTEKLQYSIRMNTPFQVKYWSEYGYNHGNRVQSGDRPLYTPSKFERLVDLDYNVYVMYDESDLDVNALMSNFADNVKEQMHIFPSYLGMANMTADLKYVGEYTPEPENGVFMTTSICTNLVAEEDQPFEYIRTDNIPTRSSSFLAHDQGSYVNIYFHDNCGALKAEGNYHKVGEEAIEFI